MVAQLPKELIVLSQASQALAEALSLDDICEIRDKAEAARHYARSAALSLEIQNFAAELKLRAERKAGEILAKMRLRGGDRRSNTHAASLKLNDFGISYSQSTRWQLEASVPDDVFETYLSLARQAQRELTTDGLIRLAKNGRRKCPPNSGTRRQASASNDDGDGDLGKNRNSPLEHLTELKNQFGLLSQVVSPMLGRHTLVTRSVEQRLAERLLSEIESVLVELTKSVQKALRGAPNAG